MVVDDGLAPSQPLPPLFVLPRLDGSFVDFDFRRRFLSGSGVAFGQFHRPPLLVVVFDFLCFLLAFFPLSPLVP